MWHIVKLLLLEFQAWNFGVMLLSVWLHWNTHQKLVEHYILHLRQFVRSKRDLTILFQTLSVYRIMVCTGWNLEISSKGNVKFVWRIKLYQVCLASLILAKWPCIVIRAKLFYKLSWFVSKTNGWTCKKIVLAWKKSYYVYFQYLCL